MNQPQNQHKQLDALLRSVSPGSKYPQLIKLGRALEIIDDFKPKEGRDYKVHIVIAGDDMSIKLEGLTPLGIQFAKDLRGLPADRGENNGKPATGTETSNTSGGNTGGDTTEHVV